MLFACSRQDIKSALLICRHRFFKKKGHSNRLCIIYFFLSRVFFSLKSKCQHFKIIYTQENAFKCQHSSLKIYTYVRFFLYLDKSRKWSLKLQNRWGTQEKKNKIKGRPGRPTSHDNKAIPHSPKELRQRCSPSHTEERRRGGKRKQNINRVPHSPLRYRYKNQGRHKQFAHHLNPLPHPSTTRQVQQCADGVMGEGVQLSVLYIHLLIETMLQNFSQA